MRKRMMLLGVCTGLMALHTQWLQGALPDEPEVKKTGKVAITVLQSDETARNKTTETLEGSESAAPKLWLGLKLGNVEGDLATFLGSTSGVLIHQVQPESPASKAGLGSGDIVISVDGKTLSNPGDLLEVMGSASEGVPLKLKIQRRSEEMEVSVLPERRLSSAHAPENRFKILRAIEGLEGLDLGSVKIGRGGELDGENSVHVFRLGDPSVVFVPDNVELKGNISIHMTKESDGATVEIKIEKESEKPAEVTVKQGDQVQTFTEAQLDQLPEDLRDWVKSVLSGKKAKWLDLKSLQANEGDAFRLELKEMSELKELSKLLSGNELKEGKIELQKVIEELTSSAKSQAHEALKQALEQAGLSAERTAQQANEAAASYAEQAMEAAKQRANQAKEYAKSIEEKVLAEVAVRKQSVQQPSLKDEIAELKSMIDQLRQEIDELRANK